MFPYLKKTATEKYLSRKERKNERFLAAIYFLVRCLICCEKHRKTTIKQMVTLQERLMCIQYLFLEICILQLIKKYPLEASNFFPMNRYCLVDNRKYDILLGKKVL